MSQFTNTQLQKLIHQALRAYHKLGGTEDDLLSQLRIVQMELGSKSADSPTAMRLATNRVLNRALDTLRLQNPEEAKIIQMRFIEGEISTQVRLILKLSPDQVKRRQRDAIDNLTQIILAQEQEERQKQTAFLDAQLPPPSYHHLFGVQHKSAEVMAALVDQNGRFQIAIIGIGGIGKTALADLVTRNATQKLVFEQVVWLKLDNSSSDIVSSAWSWVFPQLITRLCPDSQNASQLEKQTILKKYFTETPTLVVIDNIEAEAVVHQLAEQTLPYCNPSKFLFTSRMQFPLTATVCTIPLNEISDAATLKLLRHIAHEKGISDLREANDEFLLPIYQVTGGNPLAIKVVAGLSLHMPLADILADFKTVDSKAVEDVYHHIFWKAWHTLTEESQILLEVMPLASSLGMTPTQIRAATELENSKIWSAITQLVSCSLLEVQGSLQERRYSIHQLTASFLKTEIINLPQSSSI